MVNCEYLGQVIGKWDRQIINSSILFNDTSKNKIKVSSEHRIQEKMLTNNN